MSDLTVLLYLVMFAVIVGMTFAFMYTTMKATLNEFDRPRRMTNVHPEMQDVKSGEQLLVFNPEQDEDDDEGEVIIIRK